MMAVFGWFVCVAIMLFLTVIAALVSGNTLGRFNIGGAPNKAADKMLTLIFISLVGFGWYLLWVVSPFALVVK